MQIENQTLKITDFSLGLITNADNNDIPDNAASSSNNIDGDASIGKLKGIPDKSEYKSSARGFDTLRGGWIARADGTYDWIYDNGTATLGINDWYSAFGADAGVVTSRGYSFVPQNEEMHIGCGTSTAAQWVGKIYHGVMNEAVPTNLYTSDATLPVPGASTGNFYVNYAGIAQHAGTQAFDLAVSLQYALSIEYDYTQETPLTAVTAITILGAVDYVQVPIICYNGSSSPTYINKRVTAVKLYRRDIPTDIPFIGEVLGVTPPSTSTLYRLVKRLPINGLTQTGFSWIVSGNNYVASHNGSDEFIKDDNTFYDSSTGYTYGQTYENQAGIPETIGSTDMKYTVSCATNSRLFVGGCSKTEIPDATNMIFRSKEFRYDTFDWSQIGDFIRLQSKPTAMVNFSGRIWVFDLHNIYTINPDSMIIEDTTTGIGCFSQRSITVTDYGMFWCDASGAYWHNGSEIQRIDTPITASSGYWHGYDNTGYTVGSQDGTVVVQFYQKKSYVVFIVPSTLGAVNAWGFHVKRQRWDKWATISSACTGAGLFTGKNGEVYLTDGSKIYDAFGSANTKTWEWYTKNFDYGNPRQRKLLMGMSYTSSGTVAVSYSKEDASFVDNATTPMTKMVAYRTRFKIEGTATNSTFSLMTVNYRGLHLNA